MSLAPINDRGRPDGALGPVTLAWHAITIAVGILLGGLLAGRYARERLSGVTPTSLGTMVVVRQTLQDWGGRTRPRCLLLTRCVSAEVPLFSGLYYYAT